MESFLFGFDDNICLGCLKFSFFWKECGFIYMELFVVFRNIEIIKKLIYFNIIL